LYGRYLEAGMLLIIGVITGTILIKIVSRIWSAPARVSMS
jgi:hypothetical protein